MSHTPRAEHVGDGADRARYSDLLTLHLVGLEQEIHKTLRDRRTMRDPDRQWDLKQALKNIAEARTELARYPEGPRWPSP